VKIESVIIKIRNKHPDLGARKLRVLLLRKYSENEIPSETKRVFA